MSSTEALLQFCRRYCGFPDRLHPVSQMFLESFLRGTMTEAEFQRFFSLPNSTYIPLAECVVQLLRNERGLG